MGVLGWTSSEHLCPHFEIAPQFFTNTFSFELPLWAFLEIFLSFYHLMHSFQLHYTLLSLQWYEQALFCLILEGHIKVRTFVSVDSMNLTQTQSVTIQKKKLICLKVFCDFRFLSLFDRKKILFTSVGDVFTIGS